METSTTPPALAFSTRNCTIGRAMEVLGERWTLVVLREVFNGVRRFDDMQVHASVPRQVLANRLGRLVDDGILRREPYRADGQRVRHEYRLTPKGLDLYPVLVAVSGWGDRYLADPEGAPVEFEHRGCGSPVGLRMVCADGHEIEDPRGVGTRPGPGVRRR